MEHRKAENIIALVKDAQTSYLEEVEKGKKVFSYRTIARESIEMLEDVK